MQDDDVFRTTNKENRHTADGREKLNPTVMQPPIGYQRPPTIAEQIRQQVVQLRHMQDDDPETIEEADDFDIEEDPQMPSPWENDMVPSVASARETARLLDRERERLKADPEAPPKTQEDKSEKSDDENGGVE